MSDTETLQKPAQPTATRGRMQQTTRKHGSLLEVLPDVAGLQLSLVNVYFYGPPGAGDREWTLIDAGLPFSFGAITGAAAERFGPASRPAAIVLTHGHFDHVGVIRELAEHWDAPVYAHELEMPYLTGRSSYPPPDPAVGGGAMSFLSRFFPSKPIDLSGQVYALPEDGSVPGMADWLWIHTPGHAPGHISLFREIDRALIAGDAFVTVDQESAIAALVTQHQEVHRPPAYFTPDWQAARRSIEELARLDPSVAATGHGLPMYGEPLRRELAELLRNWDQLGMPSYGRYVPQPAVTNEHGVVRVPPPVLDRQLLAVAGIGAAAVLGTLMVRHWTRS